MLRFIVFAIFAFGAGVVSGQDSLKVSSGKEASPPAVEIKELVVTAQRLSIENYRAPVLTTKLGREDLRQRSPRSLPEALLGVPGVFIQKTNHGGGSPFIRGLTGQQILMLVDGIRLNNATFRSGPNQYLNTIDPAWVETIELAQSSGSTAYGSDAIGGVLQVLTHTLRFSEKTAFRPEAGVRWMSGGMEFSGEGALNASGKRWAARAGGAYRLFGDLVAGRGLGRESPSGYTQWSAEAKAAFRLNRDITLSAAYQDLEQQAVPLYHRVRLENFQYYNFDPQRRQLGYARLTGVFRQRWWNNVEFTASRQRSFEVRESRRNGSPTRVEESDETTTNGLQINIISNISTRWRMTSGAEWYGDLVRSGKTEHNENTGATLAKRGLYPDRAAMQNGAAYNLHTIALNRLTLAGGLRYNRFRIRVKDENAGDAVLRPSALVGNLGASYELLNGLRTFANVATAFRAPNVDDLGTLGIVDFRYEQPNFALEPEKSRSVEAGFKVERGVVQGQINAYYLQLRDLIGRIRTADSLQGYAVYRKENIAQAFIRGIDAQARLHRTGSPWTGQANLTYTFGQNTTDDEPLRRIPPLFGRAALHYTFKNSLRLRAETVFAGAQRRLSKADIDDNRIADNGTPGWQIINLGVFYQYRAIELSAEFHNLLNEAYRTHGSGVDGVGRCIWVRVGVQI